MKIMFIGDVHGVIFDLFQSYQIASRTHKIDAIVQLGDFGMWEHVLENENLLKMLENITNEVPIYFIRGNHEEYVINGQYPFMTEYQKEINDKYFKYFKNPIIFIDDTFAFNNLIAGFGGGESIDWRDRREGFDYWEREEKVSFITNTKINEIKRKAPKIIISHDVPTSMKYKIFPYFSIVKNGSKELDKIYMEYQPIYWLFGHYHKYIKYIDNRTNTTFICYPKAYEGFGILNTNTMRMRNYNGVGEPII